jgi:hypothetical protein
LGNQIIIESILMLPALERNQTLETIIKEWIRLL